MLAAMVSTETSLAVAQTFDWQRSITGQINDLVTEGSGVYVIGNTGAVRSGNAFVRKYDINGSEQWLRQFGSQGPQNGDNASGLAGAANATGVYLVGWAQGTLPGYSATGSYFLRKYDHNGNELWTRFTQPGETADSVAINSTGVYTVGQTQTGIARFDGYVRRFDSNGTTVWNKTFGTPLFDFPTSVAADAAGIYVTGYSQVPSMVAGSDPKTDIFILRFDLDGNEVWSRVIGGPGFDVAFGLAVAESGVYVRGSLDGQRDTDQTFPFVRKYDHRGEVKWTRRLGFEIPAGGGSSTFPTIGRGIAADPSGVYVSMGVLYKFDPDGNFVWDLETEAQTGCVAKPVGAV